MADTIKLIDAVKEFEKARKFNAETEISYLNGRVSFDETMRIQQLENDRWADVEHALKGF